MVLTGTPVVNHHKDIFGILKFLQPEIYRRRESFEDEYFFVDLLHLRGKKRKLRIIKGFKPGKQQKLQKKISQFSVNRRQREVLP